ncbi:3-hydroxymyristoyl/3-hydroxydecanoyl-(acyl carrier protein) dehydratase [Povalibacter uvarum]|uniref:3-hydroxymyristoyl/3-hydroxydecanoyl-(Acyl carrier protein) dehydratase n=1 Tax=Povalibacter uvarum TaxID=732238 RepID=A0A841HM87_9GAMM|nr:hypothetical protein [Povalibacter uvarum]MBB6093390.1 3-hydroxymyristoyl/3-hydroxydecanoyl-(acyl carrier protein) dehydratase [Povalibacter uvarum]
MLRIPEIGRVQRTDTGVRLDFAVPASLEYFEGHFPGCALLPGVVQIGWAIEFARQHIPFDASFRSLAGVKFTRVIQPGASITLLLSFDRDRNELTFEYQVDGQPCSGGRALFEVIR